MSQDSGSDEVDYELEDAADQLTSPCHKSTPKVMSYKQVTVALRSWIYMCLVAVKQYTGANSDRPSSQFSAFTTAAVYPYHVNMLEPKIYVTIKIRI